jgi:hypothetical protein
MPRLDFTEPSLHRQLHALDHLAGCTARSIPAVEAAWEDTWLLTWREAYDTSVVRYGYGTKEQLAFLEGCLATQSLATFRGTT